MMSIGRYAPALLALWAGAPVLAADLEQRVQVLERQVGALSQLVLRMESLQREVQQLRGEVELQENAMESLRKRQRDLYLDIDQRLGSAAAGNAGTTSAPGSASEPIPTGGGSSLVAPPGSTPAVPDQAPVAVTGVASAREEHAYQKAFELLNQRRYDEARAAFLKFLQSHPTSVYSDNAQYWLGEASYVTRDFERARSEFEKVLSTYPSSPKVAGAMLKIGFIQFDQGQPAQARATLDTLVSRYPDSSAARLAQEFIRKKNL
ncbi:MAG: tol-pal system protein YbgF [Gammaproteobacteria bacterium]|nr:tol-pal system protein YbgF [Gammaproteobacteria bacterium]